jgi:hypothetical protein
VAGYVESGDCGGAKVTNGRRKLNPIREDAGRTGAADVGSRSADGKSRAEARFGMSATMFHRVTRLGDGGERGMPSVAVKR